MCWVDPGGQQRGPCNPGPSTNTNAFRMAAEVGHELGRAVVSALMVPPQPVPADRSLEFPGATETPIQLCGVDVRSRDSGAAYVYTHMEEICVSDPSSCYPSSLIHLILQGNWKRSCRGVSSVVQLGGI